MDTHPVIPQNPEVLHSWKEISAYVGRGIRTIQRWEASFGFPVHRAKGELRGSVLAFRSEIDEWLRDRSIRKNGRHVRFSRTDLGLLRLRSNAVTLEERMFAFRERARDLQETTSRTMLLYSQLKQNR